jgi:hypothetical protein
MLSRWVARIILSLKNNGPQGHQKGQKDLRIFMIIFEQKKASRETFEATEKA